MSKYFTKLRVNEIENVTEFDPSTIASCVGLYAFDDITNLALDSSGLGRNGVSNGVLSANNITDGVLSRNLVGDYAGGGKNINLNSIVSNYTYNSISISFWLKIANFGTGLTLVNVNQGTTVNLLEITTTGDKLGYSMTTNSVLNISGKSAVTYTDNNWHHIVLIFDATNGNKLYIDNVQIAVDYVGGAGSAATTTTLTDFSATATSMTIGSGFTGHLDSVAFYNKELSVGEIAELFNESEDSTTTVQANKIVNKLGTVSKPSYTFINNETTGIYQPSSNKMAFVTNGANRIFMDDNSLDVENGVKMQFERQSGSYGQMNIFSDSTLNADFVFESIGGNGRLVKRCYEFVVKNVSPDTQAFRLLNDAENIEYLIMDTSGLLLTSQLTQRNPSGSVSAPSYSFSSDINTGLYSPGADEITIVTGGSDILHLDGNVSTDVTEMTFGKITSASQAVGDGNYFFFAGTDGDAGRLSCIAERIYVTNEISELLLFKGNNPVGAGGPDRIRLRAAEHVFQTYTSAETPTWPTVLDNNTRLTIGTTDIISTLLFETPTLKVTTSPVNGYVLTSDASGNATWQAAPIGSVADGIVSNAGLQFALDPDTGIYRIGTNNMGITVGGTQTIRTTVPSDFSDAGAEAYYTYETNNTTDLSGNSFTLTENGTITNTNYTDSTGFTLNNVPQFQNVNSEYLSRDISADTALRAITDLATNFTVSLWFTLNDIGADQTVFLVTELTGAPPISFGADHFFGLFYNDIAGEISFQLSDTVSGLVIAFTYPIPYDTWTHFTFKLLTSSNKAYINGEEIAPTYSAGSLDGSSIGTPTNPNRLYIGGPEVTSTGTYMDGYVKDFIITSTDLTNAQIRDLYLTRDGIHETVLSSRVIIDNSSIESFTVRKNNDSGDIMKIDTVNDRVIFGGDIFSEENIELNFKGDYSTPGGKGPVRITNTNLTTASDDNPGLVIEKGSVTTTSSQRFMQFYSNAGVQAMGGIVGNGVSNAQFVSLSDKRYKKNIKPFIDNILPKLMKLELVSFDWKNNNEHEIIGLVANDVEHIFPGLIVSSIDHKNNIFDVKELTGGLTSSFSKYLLKAVQELCKKIQELELKISKMN